MSSSASNSQPEQTPQHEAESQQAPAEHVDWGLLDKVLNETQDDGGQLDPAIQQALEAVARRHRGRPLIVDPVAVELVEAVLKTQLDDPALLAAPLRAMALRIAGTLCEDPLMNERLQAFWDRLTATPT